MGPPPRYRARDDQTAGRDAGAVRPPTLGEYELRRIKRGDVEAAVAGWTKRLGPGSVRNVRALLSQVLRAAVVDRYIAASPADGVRGPRVHRELLVPATPAQLAAWMTETPERHRAALALMAGCGLRIGEACGVTVDRMDMLRGTLRVDRQLHGARIVDVHFGPPKTASSVRTIPMPGVVRDVLAAHLARYGTGHLGTVLSTGNGSSLTTGTLRTVLTRAATRAGLPSGTLPHDARHHYASVLIDANCSVKSVQSKMGHKTAKETLDTYAHLWPDDDVRISGAIDAALGGLLTPTAVYGVCTGTDG